MKASHLCAATAEAAGCALRRISWADLLVNHNLALRMPD